MWRRNIQHKNVDQVWIKDCNIHSNKQEVTVKSLCTLARCWEAGYEHYHCWIASRLQLCFGNWKKQFLREKGKRVEKKDIHSPPLSIIWRREKNNKKNFSSNSWEDYIISLACVLPICIVCTPCTSPTSCVCNRCNVDVSKSVERLTDIIALAAKKSHFFVVMMMCSRIIIAMTILL